jgi:type I restriction enzyme M protein
MARSIFRVSSTLEEIARHGYVLTPGRYVGAEDAVDDGEPFSENMIRLTTRLSEQMAESERLDKEIRKNLTSTGFPI